MRTTGVRSAPSPAPRSALGTGGLPQPLPRTKFSLNTALEDPLQERLPSSTDVLPQDSNKLSIVARKVVTDHSSLRSRFSKRNNGNVLKQTVKEGSDEPQPSVRSSPIKCKSPVRSGPGDNSPVVSPPPKPPRTFQYQLSPAEEKHGDIRHSLSKKDPKLPNGGLVKPRDIPFRSKTKDAVQRPVCIPVAAPDINYSAKAQDRTETVVGERTPVQETVASPALQGPSSGSAQVSSIVSSVQALSREGMVSAPTEGSSSGGLGAPRPKSAWSVAARHPRGRRLPPLSLPSPNFAVRLGIGASARPRVRPLLPARPTPAQVAASLTRNGASQRTGNEAAEALTRPHFLQTAPKASAVDQDLVCTAADFEDNCKRVFQHTRVAEEHTGKGRYAQAAREYQAALTAIDRVLEAQVLAITNDEPTRQRFFHMQQEVFYTRKEALNGFSDAQAAISTPTELASSTQPQGAPPSYNDVIREDLSRSQDLLASPCSEEWPSAGPALRQNPTLAAGRPLARPSSGADEAVARQALALRRLKGKRREGGPAPGDGGRGGEETAEAAESAAASPPKPERSHSSPGSGPGKVAAEEETSVSGRRPISSSSPGSFDSANAQIVLSQAGKDEILSEESGSLTTAPAVPSTSLVTDPFVTLDPFPSVDPGDVSADDVFHDGNQPSSSTPATSVASSVKSATTKDPLQTPMKPIVSANVTQTTGACVGGAEAGQASVGSPGSDNAASDDLGDSILDALDFAVSQTPGQRRAFSHQSKGSMSSRCHSEETLLDYSYRTLENHLDSRRAICASRASIIEEFDPLATAAEESSSVAVDDVQHGDCTEPKGVKSRLDDDIRDEVPSAPSSREEGKMAPVREGSNTTGGIGRHSYYLPGTNEAANPNQDEPGGPSSVSSSGSCLSWPQDYCRSTSCPYPRITPLSAGAAEGDPWSAQNLENEASKSRATGMDVGRSAFYTPVHRKQGGMEGGRSGKAIAASSVYRDLLRIREGVKMFFIYEDGVVTAPWNRPFLAISKDPDKAWLVGEGLMLRVGDDTWACQLHSKSTLVLRMSSGIYIFGDVAGKPECKAVGVQVPSGVRQVQHELLGQILRENTLLEDERPVGITKAISKGASSAATRMNQYVEDKSMSTNRAFIRKNSIRALKGMSKRLNNLAERTGSNLKELPAEYNKLQEAADTLRSSRNAKTIQYI